MTATLRDRLLSRLIIDPSGCVLWTGATNSGGYGTIWSEGRNRFVHRLMYEMFVGRIPDGLQLDHLCRVRHCASPAHLEPVTLRVNLLRGQTPAAVNAAKTHCPAGHEFDLLNTYWNPQGSRECRACNRAKMRRFRSRKASR